MKRQANIPLLALALLLVFSAIAAACDLDLPDDEDQHTTPEKIEEVPGGDEVELGPATYQECRLLGYTFQECVELGLATPVGYSGPYVFSGSTDTITDEFCVTADKLTVEYNAPLREDAPDIYYFVTVELYNQDGQRVDGVAELEDSGSVHLSTGGPGCYYLAVTSYNTNWSLTVSQ